MPKYGGSPERRKTRRHIIVVTSLIAAVLVGGGALASNALQPDQADAQTIADDTVSAVRQLGTPAPKPTEPKPGKVGWLTAQRATPTPTPEPSPTASETAIEEPEPEPEPTESEEPETQEPAEPKPSTGNGEFPNADTTGVPGGTDLKPSDSLTITKDGTVIDGLAINGIVRVQADDVTIRNSRIVSTGRYAIEMEKGRQNLLVEDSEIDGNGVATIAILRDEFTLRRVDIHGVQDGPRIEGDNVVIEDSFIHDLHRVEGGHHDALQMRVGSNVVIRNNNLQAYNANTGDPMNAVIQFGSALGPINNVLFEGNLMNGGNYTVNGGDVTGESLVFRDNRFGRDFRYGVVAGADSMAWESNVFDDNDEPAE